MADTQRCNSIIPQKATKLYIQTSYQLVIVRKGFVILWPYLTLGTVNTTDESAPHISATERTVQSRKSSSFWAPNCVNSRKNVSWRSYSLGKRSKFFVVSTAEPMFWFKLFMVIHTNIFFEDKEFANQSCKHRRVKHRSPVIRDYSQWLIWYYSISL